MHGILSDPISFRALQATGRAILIADARGPDNPTVFVNRAFEQMTGYSADEVLGRNCRFLQNGDRDQPDLDKIREAVRTATPVRAKVRNYRTDGSLVWNELDIAPIRDEDGAVTHFIGVHKDITDRKQTKKALQRQHDLNVAILNTIDALVVVLDNQGRVAHVNAAFERMTGIVRTEVPDMVFWERFVPPEERARVDEAFRRLIRDKAPSRHENHCLTKDGDRRLIHWSNSCLIDANGSVANVIGTGLDITERHEQAQQLQRAQKMEAVGQLAGGIAHDFNNLLTVITGNLELLDQMLADRDESRPLLSDVQEAVGLGAQLTHRLLAYSRQQALQSKPTDLNQLVFGMTDMLTRTLGENISINVTSSPETPLTMVDPGQLESALLNLAINARDAMSTGGTLTITTGSALLGQDRAAEQDNMAPGHYAFLCVADTGAGMSRETKERAVEPFFTTKEKEAGTGLGLSMIYGFTRQSQGHLAIDSEIGRGTTVTLYLPAFEGGQHDEVSALPQSFVPKGRGETVLVVEDNKRVRKLTVRRFKELGYRVAEAVDGPDALNSLANNPDVDLVFSDVVMPGGIDGRQLARLVRTRYPRASVLLTSGHSQNQAHAAVDRSAAALLPKPYKLGDLARRVREVLDS